MSNNFCGKCGAKLDKNTGLCPRCDAEKLLTLKSDNSTEATGTKEPIPGNTLLSKKQAKKQRKKERKAAKETKKKEMRANWSAGKKVRNFFLKVFLIVLIIGVLVAGLIGLLVYLGIVDISTTSDVINKLETTTHPADIEKSIPDTDMNGIVYYESSEDNIVTEDGITFINNEILVILESAQYRNDLDNYLLGIGGHVVGELSDIAEYQIVLDKTYSHGTLTAIADELRSFDWVIYVSLNYAVKTKPEYTPNDSKWNNQWDATPGGDNWGIEAIEALSAWDHIDDFHTVNIGVYDTIFDVRHEDLNFAEQPLGNITAMNHVSKKDKEEDWYKHGTHTAGTISATFDNKKGVSGVSVKTNLYGVSSKGLSINDYHSSQAFNIALTYLIISKKCSVINVSLGFDELTFNASRGNIAALNALDEVSTSISNYLQVLVDQGYSFVICKSAGNQNKIGGGEEYKYYLKDSYNDNKEYMYYSHDDYIDFLNGIADEDCSDYFRRHKKDLSRRLSNGGCLDDGNVDAKYDILGAITNNKVADRIIIVGSAENLGSHYEGGFLWFGRTKIHDGYKIADFSQCGERVDILAPGVSIHSTIPNGYGRMSGTSMAAPNYEGAMALVLSKVAKDGSLAEIQEARKTIDMKMMSTANVMVDFEANDEDGKNTVTSPRMQGAGMVNLEGAYNTEVYLKGTDFDGTTLNKSKIMLRNNDDIKNGKVKLSFIAHNDSASAKTFNVSYNVMRPAIALSNKVLTSDYGAPVEVDSVKSIPGFEFYSPEEEKIIKADGTANYKDTIKVSKDIQYYQSAEEYLADDPKGVVKEGMYYCATEKAGDPIVWKEVPKSEFQSIKDVEIAKVDCGSITVSANGDTTINLPEYELTKDQKDEIQRLYANGTYVEGFVTLEAQGEFPDLSIPYMGFYSLSDRIADASFDNAPVVEPFSFEKDPTKFYGSALVNDVAKSLVGKDNADMGSMMVAGYARTIGDINTERVLSNDENFTQLKGFYPVGTKPDPYASDLTDNPKDNIYLGNPQKTNTLIIQQFMYRSVKDNFFTITNKATGQEVYRSALEDCLFGDTAGKYTLYKSHVEGSYLGAGYVAHRAWALVPLYDQRTREAFESGEYELKFNYQLAATDNWVTKAYTLHIDAETPVIKTIAEFSQDGKDMVRLTYKDTKCAYAIVGSTKVEVKYDEASKLYYSEVEKDIFDAAASSSNKTSYSDSRVFIKVVDFARGETTAIAHFDGNYSNYTLAQGSEFTVDYDFKFENGKVSFIYVDANGQEHEYTPKYGVKVSTGSLESAGSESGKKKGFFARIADFFKKIGDFFKNLFKKK